jgi:hypothetical protein
MSLVRRVLIGFALASAAAQPLSAAAPARKAPGDKVICREMPELGSRLATKRVCLTREQWRMQKDMQQENLDRVRIRTGPGVG